MESICRQAVAVIWGNDEFEWKESPSINRAGGLLCIWKKEIIWISTTSLLGKATWVYKVFGKKVIFLALSLIFMHLVIWRKRGNYDQKLWSQKIK